MTASDLKAIRHALGYTVRQLAAAIPMDERALRRMLTGKREVSDHVAQRVKELMRERPR